MNKKTLLKRHGLNEAQFSGAEKIEGSLYLSSVTTLPEGFNPTVGGSLYLSSVTTLPEGFNPTVGGSLDLRSVTTLPEGFNPTVGGDLYLRSKNTYIGAQVPELRINKNYFWKKDGKEYALVDGIFCEILSRKENTSDGVTATIYHAKSVNKERYFYIAQMGEFYAHGEELKGAMEDVRYKMMADRMKKEPIHADTIVSIEHYRVITGACKTGCAMWLESNGLKDTKEMKASDLLPLLKKTNAYGYERFKNLVQF